LLNSLSGSTKIHAIKSLIVFSKFLGRHEDFKQSMKQYGIKVDNRNTSLDSFIRILNAQNNDVIKWLAEVMPYMRKNEQLFSKFALATGLRISEVVKSFNLIIDLAHSSRIHEYYDESLNCLQHFRYKDLFIRRTKCCYLSFVPSQFIQQIANSQPVTYSAIKKNLERTRGSHIIRYNLCRDYFGTFMTRHGLIKEEVDLLQGRIPPSIFKRHYWKPIIQRT
jgi:intergrase/recombinase